MRCLFQILEGIVIKKLIKVSFWCVASTFLEHSRVSWLPTFRWREKKHENSWLNQIKLEENWFWQRDARHRNVSKKIIDSKICQMLEEEKTQRIENVIENKNPIKKWAEIVLNSERFKIFIWRMNRNFQRRSNSMWFQDCNKRAGRWEVSAVALAFRRIWNARCCHISILECEWVRETCSHREHVQTIRAIHSLAEIMCRQLRYAMIDSDIFVYINMDGAMPVYACVCCVRVRVWVETRNVLFAIIIVAVL